MADIINLKQARKRRDRSEKNERAQANRTRFGLAKAEKQKQDLERSKADRSLDQHKLDD